VSLFPAVFSVAKERNHFLSFPDEARMETLFLRCKASIEKCKQAIDMYYTVRSAASEILCNRDPCGRWFKDAVSAG
jgi:hypothetical protein